MYEVEKPYFRKFMRKREPRWKPVGKKTVRAKILQKGKPLEFKMKEYKAKYGKPSTTVDLWTSVARKGYMAVSLHYQTENRFITKVLDVAHAPAPHTAANIKKLFQDVLSQAGLTSDDIFKTVTDNAANMKKAMRSSFWVDENEDLDREGCEKEPDISQVVSDEQFDDMEVNVDEVFVDELRGPCSIHTLQLAVNDMLTALPNRYENVLRKCKAACKKQHQSQALSESASKIMPAHCTTRWNGQWLLMKVICDHFDEYREPYGFVASDKPPLSQLVTFFAPFITVTKMLESEK